MSKKNTLASVTVLQLVATGAFACTVPNPGDLGYFLYDLLVNSILGGQIGYVGAAFCAAMGARQLIHYNYGPSGPPNFGLSLMVPLWGAVWILAAGFIVNADSALVSLGAVV